MQDCGIAQVMRQAAWSPETGHWSLAEAPDFSALDFGLDAEARLRNSGMRSSVASQQASMAPPIVLLAKPPWELQSASSVASWQARADRSELGMASGCFSGGHINKQHNKQHELDVCRNRIVRSVTVPDPQGFGGQNYEDSSDDRSSDASSSPERLPRHQLPSAPGSLGSGSMFGGDSPSRSRLSRGVAELRRPDLTM